MRMALKILLTPNEKIATPSSIDDPTTRTAFNKPSVPELDPAVNNSKLAVINRNPATVSTQPWLRSLIVFDSATNLSLPKPMAARQELE